MGDDFKVEGIIQLDGTPEEAIWETSSGFYINSFLQELSTASYSDTKDLRVFHKVYLVEVQSPLTLSPWEPSFQPTNPGGQVHSSHNSIIGTSISYLSSESCCLTKHLEHI